MKKKSRFTKKDNPLSAEQTSRSEERLGAKRAHKKCRPLRNKQSASETSLLLFNQLNRVSDVLKCEYTHAEGPPNKNSDRRAKKFNQKFKMEDERITEEQENKEEEETVPPGPPPTPGGEEEGEPESKSAPTSAPAPTPVSATPKKPSVDHMESAAEEMAEEQTAEKEKPKPKTQKAPSTSTPATSEIPLFDSAVLAELKQAEAESIKTAKAIEALREEVAAYSKKENLTEDEIKTMLKKQEQLMEKLAEFEAMTKKVGDLVGLAQVASSQLGPPQKPMVHMVDSSKGPSKLPHTNPEDTLPKVIVCGTGDIDQVPRIIVCEPTKARDGKHPLYPQIHGSNTNARQQSRMTFQPGARGQSPGCEYTGGGFYQPGQGMPGQGMPGYAPGAYPGPAGAYMQGGPTGYPGASPMQGMPGFCPGMMGPGSPQGMMVPGGPQGMMGPGGPQGMMGPGGPQGMMGMMPGMMPNQGVLPPCLPLPLCPPMSPKKHKKHKKDKDDKADTETKAKTDAESEPQAETEASKQCELLMQQMESLKGELKTVVDENQNLKKMVGDKSGGGAKPEMRNPGGICKGDLQKGIPMCKAEAYRAMGLPIPGIGTKQTCPGAKFAASMGWNENQGCRSELNKSVNCPDMLGKDPNQGQQQAFKSGGGDVPVFSSCGCKTAHPPTTGCPKGDMETVVQTMEQEVKSLQKELELVQAERRGLALQKKLLQCMADGGPPPGGTGGGGAMPTPKEKPCKEPEMNQRCLPLQQLYQKPAENLSAVEMQLNSLREQYRKLQEDFNAKVEEVSMVRVEHESAKRDALQLLEKCREAEARVDDLLERLRVIEIEKTRMAGSKDQMTELDQQLTLAKQRYREGQEELDELKTTMQDQMLQLEEYRNKYLSAQQTVEEQRRQIDIMELENNRIGEQVNLEIQRVKTQFQEKLQELTPLPDMLKATQLKLQECDQLRQLAERNVEQLLNQSDDLKEQNKALEKELDELKKNSDNQTAERSNLKSSLSSGEKKIEEIKSENIKLRATVARLEELALNNDRRLDEKTHEVLQLQTQLETLREESARQVSRTKDRCEAVRRTLQGQISQLECQLAQSRAAARTAQKDRDEIRQRMQAQITSLNDNFEQAQLRIRSLQSHVNYLKNSYTNIFAPGITTPLCPKPIDGMTT